MKKRIGLQRILIGTGVISSLALARYCLRPVTGEGWDAWFFSGGLALMLFGYALRMLARGYKHDISNASHALVTGGIYACTRNPMYLGTFFIGVGAVMSVLNLWVVFLFAAVYLLIYIPQILREERWLKEHFGDEYLEYCRRVPRVFPRPGGMRALLAQFVGFRWEWARREAISRLIVLSAILFVQTARAVVGQGGWSLNVVPFGLIILMGIMAVPAIVQPKGKV